MVKIQQLSLTNLVRQGEGNIVSDMNGEKVMLSITNGKYYNLGDMGGEIWDLMKESISINQIITILLSKYEVDQSECEEQVTSFLKHLHEEELILVEEATK
jgi:acetylornithine/succinyldiaminopimelate/putrescine aminotransferase